MKKQFEIGDWIECEDGLGQILFIRNFYVEPYETNRNRGKTGDFLQTIFICKILCDFKGKLRKRRLINIYTSCDLLKDKYQKIVSEIKINNSILYNNYLNYEDKIDICKQVFLTYKLDEKLRQDTEEMIYKIRTKLYPAFTFKEFRKEFQKMNFSFEIGEFYKYGCEYNKNDVITLRFDSYLYKVKNKETIFHNVVFLTD